MAMRRERPRSLWLKAAKAGEVIYLFFSFEASKYFKNELFRWLLLLAPAVRRHHSRWKHSRASIWESHHGGSVGPTLHARAVWKSAAARIVLRAWRVVGWMTGTIVNWRWRNFWAISIWVWIWLWIRIASRGVSDRRRCWLGRSLHLLRALRSLSLRAAG